MNQKILCKSLFPIEKGDFNSEHLTELIESTPSFLEWLKESFSSAYNQLNNIECAMSKRLRSTNIHEFVFVKLTDNLSNYTDLSGKVSISTSSSGNKRNFFTFDKYIFILHKEDATTNNTTITSLIKNQTAPAHIITIEYAVGMMYNSITSLSLEYYEGKTSSFSYKVPLCITVEENGLEESQEIIATKPKLSNKVMGKKSVG